MKLHFLILFFGLIIHLSLANEGDFLKYNNDTNYKIISVIKRNRTCYTQGLLYDEPLQLIMESCGLYHQSSIRMYFDLSFSIKKEVFLPKSYFGEGIGKCQNMYYQLTWKEKKVIKYTPSLQYIKTLFLPSPIKEGWGLSSAVNPNELILTDGSNKIYWINCASSFEIIKQIEVIHGDKKVMKLNDLVYAEGYVWANQYLSSYIYKIDYLTGKVVKRYDLKNIINFEYDKKTLTTNRLKGGDVMNGITYLTGKNTFLITGKKWGYYYEISFN